jgi:hypothetical protein
VLAAGPTSAGAGLWSDPPSVLVFGAIALGALGLAWAVTWWVWRSPPGSEPGEHAFRVLARRLGLTHAQRRMLRRLGKSLHAQPVALVLCREAFDRAARRAVRAEEAGEALALQERLFGRR